jgi:hypothetical protein
MDEVPLPERPLLTLDEQRALAGENEERLLLVLGVVEAVRLARLQDLNPDPELREHGVRALEDALRAGRALLAVLRRQPHGVAHVHDEPTLAGR